MQLPRRLPTGAGQVYYQIDPYVIISMLFETLCYGMFLVLFLVSTVLLLQRRKVFLRERVIEPAKLRGVMLYLIMGVLMFLAITAKWSFWWAEVLPIPAYRPGIIVQLPRRSRIVYRFKEVCIQLAVMLGDMMTIYRLWILSNRNKIMVMLPVSSLLGYLACSVALSGPANDTNETPLPIKNGRLELSGWDVAATSCTLGITIYITLMITWIITTARLRVKVKVLGHGLRQALAVIVESAALYTMWTLTFLIAGLGFHSEIALTFLDCMPEVYGISVMLINVRIGLGWARNGEHVAAPLGGYEGRNVAFSPESRGVYLSTVVYTQPSLSQSEGSCSTQSRAESEHGDIRSIYSSGKNSKV